MSRAGLASEPSMSHVRGRLDRVTEAVNRLQAVAAERATAEATRRQALTDGQTVGDAG